MQVNSIVSVTGKQKIGEDGKERGYSWYCDPVVGVLISKDDKSFTIIKADKQKQTFKFDDEDYFYSFSEGSDVEMLNEIEKEMSSVKNTIKDKEELFAELNAWHDKVKYEISFTGRMVSFIRSFIK